MKKVVTGVRVVVGTILRKAKAGMGAQPAVFEAQLLEELHARLKKSEVDKFKLHEEFLDRGINLAGIIGRSLGSDYPWCSATQCHHYMPDYTGVESYLKSESNDPQEGFVRLDQLFKRAFAVSLESGGDQADHSSAKAEIFAAVLSSSYSLPYLCASPVMHDYAGAWFDKLTAGPEMHAVACTSLLYKRFEDITLNKPVEALRALVAEGFIHYGQLLASHRIETTGQTKFGSDWDTIKGSARIVGLTTDQRAALSVMAYRGGNLRRFHATVDAVFDEPEVFASTLIECGVSQEDALDTVRYCMSSWIRGIQNFVNPEATKNFLDSHRTCLQEKGYQDIFGTKAMDPLAKHLELGEYYAGMDYLRCDDLGLAGQFASYHEANRDSASEISEQDAEAIIRRKVALAVRLNQRKLLMNAADELFSGHRATNKDLSSPVGVMCLLEHGVFKPSEILRTELRVQKAIEWGLGKLICQDPALKKYTARAFTADLGV
ncbi:hypothetical protein [Pseudomonas sp. PLMAX]|uniref:hypothetical protein n=1 Tax=Pseudomonas sp. PLMAX TaxID=2201998 RepID=UPI0038B7A641